MIQFSIPYSNGKRFITIYFGVWIWNKSVPPPHQNSATVWRALLHTYMKILNYCFPVSRKQLCRFYNFYILIEINYVISIVEDGRGVGVLLSGPDVYQLKLISEY